MVLDLRDLMRDREIFPLLERHFRSEFSAESLLFIRQLDLYKKLVASGKDQSVISRRATHLYSTFVKENGALPLNIRKAQRQAIRDALSGSIETPETTSNSSESPRAVACGEEAESPVATPTVVEIVATGATPCPTRNWMHLFDDIEHEVTLTITDTLLRFQMSAKYQRVVTGRKLSVVADESSRSL